jgi:hypothetical protein
MTRSLPTAAAILALSFSASIPADGQVRMGYPFDVAVDESGGRLLVAAGNAGTHVYDIRDGIPRFATTLAVEGGGYHRNLKVAGTRCFLADAKRLLVVADLGKRPQALLGGAEGSGMGIDVRGDLVAIAAGKDGLRLFRFEPPDVIRPLGSCSTGGEAWDVWLAGGFAYVADVEAGLAVIDLADPGQPRTAGGHRWAEGKCTGQIVRGEGGLLAVAAGPQGLHLYRLEAPGRPVHAALFHEGGKSCAEGLALRGGLVYLASGDEEDPGRNGLVIVDAREPSRPRAAGRAPFPGWVEGVCLRGDTAYIANTGSGVRAVAVGDPSRPRVLNGPPAQTAAEKEETEGLNRLLRGVLAGEPHRDASTPGGAYIAMLHALVKDDMELYRELNPLHAKALAASGSDLSGLRGMVRRRPPEICWIVGGGKGEEGEAAAIYTGLRGQPLDIEVFAFHRGKWRKLFDTGGRVDDAWTRGVPRAFEEMKRAIK